MIRIWAVMRRDLLRTSRNPFAIFSAVLLPLVYLFILGNSLQGVLTGMRLGVVSLDQGIAARNLLGALQAVSQGPHTFDIVRLDSPGEGFTALKDGDLQGLLVIPPEFSRELSLGRAASAGLYLDNVESVASGAIQAAVQSVLPAIREPLAHFELHLGQAEIRPQELYPRVDYDASLIPGVVVMSIFMGSMITGAFNLVFDRFLGVHESYLSTPLKRMDINFGVLGAGVLVTLASSTLVLAVGMIATGTTVHGGILGWLALFAVVVISALGMLAMMMVVLGRANHPRVTGVLSGFLNVILFFPSGALYPLASFPNWLKAFAKIDPETHAVYALKAILFRGGDLAAAGMHVFWLAIFAAAMLALSTVTLKRTL